MGLHLALEEGFGLGVDEVDVRLNFVIFVSKRVKVNYILKTNIFLGILQILLHC